MSDVATNDVVRHSKVVPPRLPARLLPRPQLIRDLQQSLSVRVTLVIAGAGYGKTTTIAQAMEELQRKRGGPVLAWLQLDEYDVDRVAFFNALVAAMEQAVPTFFQKWRSQLAVMNTAEFSQRFSDELGAINQEVVFVIEDIHWLIRGEKEAYKALSPIIDQLPNNVHVIMTSRKVLMMECAARMRARQQLIIMGKEKLTMSVEEVRRLLHDVYQEDVPDDLVRRIAAQVEGWVTGVVLLLQARYVLEIQAWDSFLGLISGDSHEFFFAYFMSEVYERLSENMRRCLRLVAELPEWDVKVVQEIYGDEVTRELTRYVADENALFVFAVDERHTRFRFHPMFRDFLRAQGPLGDALLNQLAEHEYVIGNHRVSASLFRQCKSWERMLDSLYQMMLVKRREAISPVEVRELLEAVPADVRHTFQAWWVMRAAQLIYAGEISEVSKLPCNYKKFKEPFKTKFLGLLAQAMRNEGRSREVIDMLAPVATRHLKKADQVSPQEVVSLIVTYTIALIDESEIEKSKVTVQWLEQRKLIAPETEDDDLVYLVLRAYYENTGNIEQSIYYALKRITHVRQYKIFALSDALLNLGSTYSQFEYLKEAEEVLREGMETTKRFGQTSMLHIFYAELAMLYLRMGDSLRCLDFLSKIPLDDKFHNPAVVGFAMYVKAEASVSDRKTSDTSFMFELYEHFHSGFNLSLFFDLAFMYRAYQPAKPNSFIENKSLSLMERCGDPFFIELVKESEELRIDQNKLPIWEKSARNFVANPNFNINMMGFASVYYLFEIMDKIPELTPTLLSTYFKYRNYTILNYLYHDWDRFSIQARASLIAFVSNRIDTKQISRGLYQLLTRFSFEKEILESTKVIELLSTSEFLTEEEIGPLLLKYRSVSSSAEEALRQYGNREPEPLSIRMFGKFEITKGNKKIEFSKEVTQPMISVLKLLLRKRDEIITLDSIADTVWKDIGSKQAKNNVYAAISQLRTSLEPYLLSGKDSHFIKAEDRGYMFAYRIVDTLDVEEFESLFAASSKQRGERAAQTLIKAVKLYKGKYLEENQYDEWADGERDRLQQMYVNALTTIVSWYRKVNAWDEVELYGTSGFVLEPENEDFCGALLECAAAKREMYSLKKVFSDHQIARNEIFGEMPSKGIQDLYQTCLDKL